MVQHHQLPGLQRQHGDLIRRFYEELWNPFDKRRIPEPLTDDVRFRGSLGDEKPGHHGFTEYMDKQANLVAAIVSSATTIAVEVPAANSIAVKFYERFGFRPRSLRLLQCATLNSR